MFTQKIIIKKMIQVGSSTLLSRFFGIVREILIVKYLGASGLSDTFLTAYKIPNSLRKIFAEGALSAAFIPTVVKSVNQDNKNDIARLMSLAFLFFEGMVIILCALIMYHASSVIQFIAPGFSPEQIKNAVPMVHILMPFIFFISSSALLSAPLHAIGNFFISAIAPIVINIIFIIGLLISIFFNLPVTSLCWFILWAGVAHFLLHFVAYLKANFSFGPISLTNIHLFGVVIVKFLLCLPSTSLMEVALFIDTSFASLLAPGSISLISYANRFVGIPLGVFAVAFSTILLPHFSRINICNPKRLHFYLLESTKFIFWVTIPVALIMTFFSQEIFSTIFLSDNFTLAQAQQTGNILVAFLIGLFFFSLNKILLNIFYAMHATSIPALIALFSTIINILFNMLFIEKFKTVGLALATTLASILQTLLFLIVLHRKYQFRIYLRPFFVFVIQYTVQLALFITIFWPLYYLIIMLIKNCLSASVATFFIAKIGLWLWVSPLIAIFLFMLYYSRNLFNVRLYFLR